MGTCWAEAFDPFLGSGHVLKAMNWPKENFLRSHLFAPPGVRIRLKRVDGDSMDRTEKSFPYYKEPNHGSLDFTRTERGKYESGF